MAYPESYDELTGLDLGECALYAHTLTDGILDTTSNIELDSRYYVYAIYGSAVPKLDIIDPLNDELFVSAIEGEYLENASLYRFTVDVPTAYTTAEGETSWAEKGAVLKLYSDDSPLIFRKHIDIITKSSGLILMCLCS
jgi:hypothetical protein